MKKLLVVWCVALGFIGFMAPYASAEGNEASTKGTNETDALASPSAVDAVTKTAEVVPTAIDAAATTAAPVVSGVTDVAAAAVAPIVQDDKNAPVTPEKADAAPNPAPEQ